jgi:hypothetical protein
MTVSKWISADVPSEWGVTILQPRGAWSPVCYSEGVVRRTNLRCAGHRADAGLIAAGSFCKRNLMLMKR